MNKIAIYGAGGFGKEVACLINFINNNLKIMVNTFEVLKKFKKKFIFATTAMSDFHFSSYGNLKLIYIL